VKIACTCTCICKGGVGGKRGRYEKSGSVLSRLQKPDFGSLGSQGAGTGWSAGGERGGGGVCLQSCFVKATGKLETALQDSLQDKVRKHGLGNQEEKVLTSHRCWMLAESQQSPCHLRWPGESRLGTGWQTWCGHRLREPWWRDRPPPSPAHTCNAVRCRMPRPSLHGTTSIVCVAHTRLIDPTTWRPLKFQQTEVTAGVNHHSHGRLPQFPLVSEPRFACSDNKKSWLAQLWQAHCANEGIGFRVQHPTQIPLQQLGEAR